MVRNTTERVGANIMGKRMFDQGEVAWPEEAPFHFINDGPARALELARDAADHRDVRIAGGADVIQQYLKLDAVRATVSN